MTLGLLYMYYLHVIQFSLRDKLVHHVDKSLLPSLQEKVTQKKRTCMYLKNVPLSLACH